MSGQDPAPTPGQSDMTDQIDGKAVERFDISESDGGIMEAHPYGEYVRSADYKALLSERDALQAQVEGLTKERDFENGSRLASEAQLGVEIDRLMRERDAALAREGAVAMGMIKLKSGKPRLESNSDYSRGWNDAMFKLSQDIPTDAAAALAQREDEVFLAGFMASCEGYNGEYPCPDHGYENDARWCFMRDEALKRSGKETK